jgi:hypothetical protein
MITGWLKERDGEEVAVKSAKKPESRKKQAASKSEPEQVSLDKALSEKTSMEYSNPDASTIQESYPAQQAHIQINAGQEKGLESN